jgi:cytochrome P450
MKPFTFLDATIIPKGSFVVAPVAPIHMDESVYDNPNQFHGFRFSDLREGEGESARHYVSKTSLEFLHFGHGHHAW